MKIIGILFAIFFYIAGTIIVPAQNWTKIEGTDPYINVIYLTESEPDKIIVAADNDEFETPFNPKNDVVVFPQFGGGLFVSADRGNSFSDAKLSTFSVYAIMQHPVNKDTYYCSARTMTRGGITSSTDGGNSWNENMPFLCDGSYQIMSLSTNDAHYPDMYAAGLKTDLGFFHTDDDFASCNVPGLLKIQSRSVAVSPINENLIFLAGDGFYAGGVYRSYDKGQTWIKDSSGLENLRIHCVVPSKYDGSVVFCGADSVTNSRDVIGKGVYMSRDTGKTWTNVGAFGCSCYDIAEHPYQKEFVIAACGEHGIYLSGSEGSGYEDLSDGLPEGVIVTKVAFPYWSDVEAGKVIAFAGTYGDGLYKSMPIYTSVSGEVNFQQSISINRVYPNPASSDLSVSFTMSDSKLASFDLYDIYGNCVLTLPDKYFNKGDNIMSIKLPEDISVGVYYLRLKAGSSFITETITVMK
jgi:hypothetical protein